MNQSLPQFFGLGATFPTIFRDPTGGAIMSNDVRIFDRQVSSNLLKVRYRITPFCHHFVNQSIRLFDGTLWIITKKPCVALQLSRYRMSSCIDNGTIWKPFTRRSRSWSSVSASSRFLKRATGVIILWAEFSFQPTRSTHLRIGPNAHCD